MLCIGDNNQQFVFRFDLLIADEAQSNIQYVNAKVLVVGDSSAGKTGLAYRLCTGETQRRLNRWSVEYALLAP